MEPIRVVTCDFCGSLLSGSVWHIVAGITQHKDKARCIYTNAANKVRRLDLTLIYEKRWLLWLQHTEIEVYSYPYESNNVDIVTKHATGITCAPFAARWAVLVLRALEQAGERTREIFGPYGLPDSLVVDHLRVVATKPELQEAICGVYRLACMQPILLGPGLVHLRAPEALEEICYLMGNPYLISKLK